jgi:hypothetical protein
VDQLLDDERAALIYERDHKWHGPKMLWYSIGLCAVGAATQGWDQTVSRKFANFNWLRFLIVAPRTGLQWRQLVLP